MEAKLCFPHGGISNTIRRPTLRPECFHTIQSVSTSPSRDENLRVTYTKTAYNDNWFDRMAINYLSQSLQLTTGLKSDKTGYDSLVEAATVVSQRFDKEKQRELVMQTLDNAFPKPILSFIRTVLPTSSKFTREYFAVFTTIFFAWLVGPCEVKEGKIDGKTEKNVVHITKCRFLEGTSCVGMCTNLCKMPSQKFIKDSLGVPFNMVPNFDDMSCDMIFGEEPPAPSDDPALKQPCYKFICKAKKKHRPECAS